MNEQKMPESIEFLGLNLSCISYKEYDTGGAIMITFRTDVTPDQHEAIKRHWQERRIGNYGPVVLHGYDQSPLTMRLGNPQWSAHDGYYKYSVTLVEDKYDQIKRPDHGLIDDKNRNNMVLETAAKLEALTHLLVEKGLLDKDQLNAIQSEIPQRVVDLKYQLRRHEDLDNKDS